MEIHYAVGAGDPSTAEGGLLIALQQAFDEYERAKLSRETKRGMRQTALQGFRCGGRAALRLPARAQRPPRRCARQGRRGQDPARARPRQPPRWWPRSSTCGPTRARLQGDRRPPQPPRRAALPRATSTPSATSAATGPSRRSARSSRTPPTPAGWSGTGSTSPPSAKPAARPACAPATEWVVSEVEHLPLVSDELFAAAQERFAQRGRAHQRPAPTAKPTTCSPAWSAAASGHQPLAMYGRTAQGHHLHDLRLRAHLRQGSRRPDRRARPVALPPRGRPAAARRAVLRRADLRPDAPGQARPPAPRPREDRAPRPDGGTQQRPARAGRRPRPPDRPADRGAGAGHRARARRASASPSSGEPRKRPRSTLRALAPAAVDSEASRGPGRRCSRASPTSADALHQAPPSSSARSSTPSACRSRYDKVERRIEISATITEAIADAFENAKDLPQEVSSVAQRDIAGAGFEPATFGL